MEQIKNASLIPPAGVRPRTTHEEYGSVRVSDRLRAPPDTDVRPVGRADGWTPERIRTFLRVLSECGVVADAVRAAGMSKASAYAFRNSARGRSFDTAWRAALLLARRSLADEVMSRAVNGCVEVMMRDGEVLGERHRFDNRLTMAVLTRLDNLADSDVQLNDGPRRAAHEFDAFVDAVCDGNAESADFLRTRAQLSSPAFGEAEIIARNEAYRSGEPGLAHAWQPSNSSTSLDLEAFGAELDELRDVGIWGDDDED